MLSHTPGGPLPPAPTAVLFLAARGKTPRRTENGDARVWQGATREQIGHFRPRSNAVQARCSAVRMQRGFYHGLLALATLVAPLPGWAQSDSGKRALEIADYAQWRTISGSQISHDGRWVAWTYSRVRGDDALHVKALDSDVSHEIASASAASFSDDGRWVAYFISPPFLDAEKLRRDTETVTRQAGLLELATGETLTWEDADSFGFSDGSSHFYVKKRNTNDEEKPEHEGTGLILRNLREGFEELIGSVGEADFNDAGTHFAFTVDAEGKDGNGLYLLDLATGSRRGLDN